GVLTTVAVVLAIQRGLFNLDALETLTSEQDLVYRTGIWQGTWLMLQQVPYTGLGAGTFPLLYPFFTPPSQPLAATNPHNVLLQLYADGGILAVAAAGWGAIVFARLAYATLRASHSRFWTAIAAGTVAALLGHAVYGVFESVISLTFRDGSGGFHYIPSPLPWIMGAFLVVAWREALHTKSLPSLTIDRSVEALVR
ncbi:MAG: O-antigen ligase family protein, partial [Chloroflexi bacterium]|nr:O-antigen ligase family protein [Chloroflexota bacterium]